MKVIFFLVMIFIPSLRVNAQLAIVPNIGINLANMSITPKVISPPNTQKVIGLYLGSFIRMKYSENVYIESGVFYSSKGVKTWQDLSTGGIGGTLNLDYLEVPVNLGCRFPFEGGSSMFVTIGPYAGYASSGFQKNDTIKYGGQNDGEVQFGSRGQIKRMDYGLNISAGYQLRMGLLVSIKYGFGLRNISNYQDVPYNNRVLSFCLSYLYNL